MNIGIDESSTSAIPFSSREIDIIRCIADGLNSDEISKKLFISEHTVKEHRKNILAKSSCKNTAHLVKTSVLQGLI